MVEAKRKVRRRATKAKVRLLRESRLTGRLGFLQHWQSWGVIFVACAGVMGTVSVNSLLHQPTHLSCQYVFWPFASASLRFYCAQERANKRTLEDLMAAIALVDALGADHPLRRAINPRIERWSEQALDLAGEAFHDGELDRAIEFARKIPAQTEAAKRVKERIEKWQVVWAEGEGIFREAEATLNAENWRKSFWIMVKLLRVNNRYWSDTKYTALSKRILQAQRDEIVIAEGRSLMRRGGLDNLAKALAKVREVSAQSVFQKSAKNTVNEVADRLMKLAERALKRNDLTTALDAAQLVPRQATIWRRAQDFEDLAYASASAWSGTIAGLEDAIKDIQKIKIDSPLYDQAQALILKWQGQVANLRYAQENPPPVEEAPVALLEPQSYVSDSVAPDINDVLEDLPEFSDTQDVVLSEADTVSLQGDRDSLQAAIDLAETVLPGQASYEDAQARVAEWRVQLERLSELDVQRSQISEETEVLAENTVDTIDPQVSLINDAQQAASPGTPDALAAAITTANQVSEASPLHAQSRELVEAWSEQLLSLARRRAPRDIEQAIAIAQRIPPYSPVYEAAQLEINDWQARQIDDS